MKPMMNTQGQSFIVSCSILLLLLVVHFSLTTAVEVFPSNYKCTNFSYPGGGIPFEVCYVNEVNSVKGTNTTNDTVFFRYNYTFYNRLQNHTSKNDSIPIINLGVSKASTKSNTSGTSLSKSEYVSIFNIPAQCKKHRYCGNDTYSTDCTNIVYGRIVKCESLYPIFFPFTEQAITSGIPLYVLQPLSTTPNGPNVPNVPTISVPTSVTSPPLSSPIPSSLRPISLIGTVSPVSIIPSYIPSSLIPSYVPSQTNDPTNTASIIPSSGPSMLGDPVPTVPTVPIAPIVPTVPNVPTAPTVDIVPNAPSTIISAEPTQQDDDDTIDNGGDNDHDNVVRCTNNFTYPSYPTGIRPFQVCYITNATARTDISFFTNGTQKNEVTRYSHTYTIFSRGNFKNTNNSNPQRRVLFTISVGRTVENGTKYDKSSRASVKVNGIGQCKWAKYCGNNTMMADCTNMVFGRKTEKCESLFPLFFPFVQDSIKSNKSLQIVKPVKKPSSSSTIYPDGVECISNMTFISSPYGTNIPEFELCFKSEATALGGGVSSYPNGTIVYGEPSFTNLYQIYYKSRFQTTPTIVYNISVSRTGTTCSGITINDQQCTSCTYCNGDSSSSTGIVGYQYDCANLPYGRETYKDTCEAIENADANQYYPLFPLKYGALVRFDSTFDVTKIRSEILGSVEALRQRIKDLFQITL